MKVLRVVLKVVLLFTPSRIFLRKICENANHVSSMGICLQVCKMIPIIIKTRYRSLLFIISKLVFIIISLCLYNLHHTVENSIWSKVGEFQSHICPCPLYFLGGALAAQLSVAVSRKRPPKTAKLPKTAKFALFVHMPTVF